MGCFSHGRSNTRGVAILFSRGFNPQIENTIKDEEGRLLILQIKNGEEVFTLANLYAPTQSEAREQNAFMAYIDESLAKLEMHTLIMGGDFNVQLDRQANSQSRLSANTDSGNIRQVILFKADLVSSQPTSYRTFAQFLKTWVKFHNYDPTTESEVQEEVLWHNRDITISGKPFSWPLWKEAGISSINDLLHKEEPRFSSHLEITEEFNIQCSFLQVLQLRSAIPYRWKWLLWSPRRRDLVIKPLIKAADGNTIQVVDALAKSIYKAILTYKLPKVSSQVK